jgi:hypothetical protein
VSDGVEVKSGFDHSKFSPTPTQIDDDRPQNNIAPEFRYDTLCYPIHMYAYSDIDSDSTRMSHIQYTVSITCRNTEREK